MAYLATTVYHLPMLCSDHAPILAVLNSSRIRTNKPFHFENWCLIEQDYQKVAQDSWNRSASRPFIQKNQIPCFRPPQVAQNQTQTIRPASHYWRPDSPTTVQTSRSARLLPAESLGPSTSANPCQRWGIPPAESKEKLGHQWWSQHLLPSIHHQKAP